MGRYMWRLPVLAIGAVAEGVLAGVLAFHFEDTTKQPRDAMLLWICIAVPVVVGAVAQTSMWWPMLLAVAIPVGSFVGYNVVDPSAPFRPFSGIFIFVGCIGGVLIAFASALVGMGLRRWADNLRTGRRR
jgi:peptidoglycan/LPS O-acetylase OafA/YrhL